MGKLLAPRQGAALSEVWFSYSRASARHISGRRCGQDTGPLRWVGEAGRGWSQGGGFLPFYQRLMLSSVSMISAIRTKVCEHISSLIPIRRQL